MRVWQGFLGWWQTHRGGIAASVVATLAALVALWAFHVIPHFGGGHANTTAVTDASAPPVPGVTLPAGLERDPPGHKLRNIHSESSAEFFDGELVISIGTIRNKGQGEYSISRIVFRAASGGHCELPGVLVGGAWELAAESGRHYRVDVRGIAQNFAGVVAYTDPTRVVTPGPSHCLLLFPKPLP